MLEQAIPVLLGAMTTVGRPSGGLLKYGEGRSGQF